MTKLVLLLLWCSAACVKTFTGPLTVCRGVKTWQDALPPWRRCGSAVPCRPYRAMAMMAEGQKTRKNLDRRKDEKARRKEAEAKGKPLYDVTKLSAEAKTPFRNLRLFLYGGFGISALIGSFTAITQLIAALTGQPGALEVQQCLTNVAVDVGVVTASAFAFTFEIDLQKKVQEETANDTDVQAKAAESRITNEDNIARVNRIRDCSVNLQAEDEGKGSVGARVGTLMSEAQQHIVVLAGRPKMLKESLTDAMILKAKVFAKTNILVVPVQVSAGGSSSDSDKGFAPKDVVFQQGYVAEPSKDSDWQQIVQEEISFAERQGQTKALKQGIVLVIRNDGKIVRRGVGQPDWEMVLSSISPEKGVRP